MGHVSHPSEVLCSSEAELYNVSFKVVVLVHFVVSRASFCYSEVYRMRLQSPSFVSVKFYTCLKKINIRKGTRDFTYTRTTIVSAETLFLARISHLSGACKKVL